MTEAALDRRQAPAACLVSLEGFAEAPTLSRGTRRLYYHQRAKNRFVICRVRRTPAC